MTTSTISAKYEDSDYPFSIEVTTDGKVNVYLMYDHAQMSVSDLLLLISKHQQYQHGERVEARKKYNGPY